MHLYCISKSMGNFVIAANKYFVVCDSLLKLTKQQEYIHCFVPQLSHE